MLFDGGEDAVGGKKHQRRHKQQRGPGCGGSPHSQEYPAKRHNHCRKTQHHTADAVDALSAHQWFLILFPRKRHCLANINYDCHRDYYHLRQIGQQQHKQGYQIKETSRGGALFGLVEPTDVAFVAIGILLEHHHVARIDKPGVGCQSDHDNYK